MVYKGEHWVLTRLQWRKYVSKGFIDALEQYIIDKRGTAVNLDEEYDAYKESKAHKKSAKPV